MGLEVTQSPRRVQSQENTFPHAGRVPAMEVKPPPGAVLQFHQKVCRAVEVIILQHLQCSL